MAPSSEDFALDMTRACMPLTKSDIQFDYGSMFSHVAMEHGGDGAFQGVMNVMVRQDSGADVTFAVEYSLMGTGDGITWTEGTCTIRFSGRLWEYYCVLENGVMQVTTMEIMRRRRALKKAVQSALSDLGGSFESIARQLRYFGFSPEIKGLRGFVGEIFALVDVEIVEVTRHGRSLPEIRGRRDDQSDLELKLYNPSGAIGKFVTQLLSTAS